MTYPLKERTYFTSQAHAWAFAQEIAKLSHHVVSDYGRDNSRDSEPYFVETLNDPFETREELLSRVTH
jgi:hypothetical protein